MLGGFPSLCSGHHESWICIDCHMHISQLSIFSNMSDIHLPYMIRKQSSRIYPQMRHVLWASLILLNYLVSSFSSQFKLFPKTVLMVQCMWLLSKSIWYRAAIFVSSSAKALPSANGPGRFERFLICPTKHGNFLCCIASWICWNNILFIARLYIMDGL